ncbi:hypothetical protein AGMMS49959_13460 [Planctomycetales bacterium]|nr:hypothetical protein AGMMS49959_13460 [Planctomycetales bacterium]
MPLAVSIEELSRYIDGEVSSDEQLDLERRLLTCPAGGQILDRLRDAMLEIGLALLEQRMLPENAPTDHCLTDDQLVRLADNALTPAELPLVETHVAACPHCTRRVLETTRAAVTVDAANWRELPENLRDDPRLAPLKNVKPKPRKMEYANIKKKKFTGRLRGNVQEEFFNANGYLLKLTIRPQIGDFANIEVLVMHGEKPRSQEEVLVTSSEQTTPIFRGSTSLDGRVLVRRLRAGVYFISLVSARLEAEIAIDR